jgi:tight adherence protein B
MDATWVLFAGLCTVFGLIALALGGGGGGSRERLRRRAESLNRRSPAAGSPAPETIRRVAIKSRLPSLDRLAGRLLPRRSALRDRLARSGRDISLGGYVGACCAVAMITVLVCAPLAGLAWSLAGTLGLAAGMGLPHWWVGRLGRRRVDRFIGLFPDAIDLIVRGLRSVLPISESVTAVGREMPDPLGHEFRLIGDRVRFGSTLEEALWDAARRLDAPEFHFFIVSLAVQRETGGNLAETLANLSDILRRRRQMRLKVRAMSSEARASAMILGGLPFVMFAILYLVNPSYEMELFTDPRGRMMLGAGLFTMTLGILVMRRMVKFEI